MDAAQGSRSRGLAAHALPAEGHAQPLDHQDRRPTALLLYPDSGSPGFAEVPHMGSLEGASSGSPDWPQAAAQIVHRVVWDLGEPAAVEFRALGLDEFCQEVREGVAQYDLILGVDLMDEPPSDCAPAVRAALERTSSRLFITSSPARSVPSFWRDFTLLGGAGAEELQDPGPLGLRAALGGWSAAAKLRGDVEELWQRRTAEEAVYAILDLIDGALEKLPAMQQQKPVPNFETISRAIDRCQDEFRGCFTQPRCLQSLACLSTCGLADQSCSYRCIVSYQSEAFTQFTLCALQKQNLLNSQVERPSTPLAVPLETFRGEPLTHEVAEQILVGHYDPSRGQRHSWLVTAGSNPAYEQFSLQYQLWYKGSGRGAFWYHPTFLVEALDGRKIWRTRDYRVRRKDVPGMWEFSVLDNGIISEEKWHLLGCDDDLTWLVLFYVGAARKAGLTYRGCLVLTQDGQMPGPAALPGVEAAVAKAGLRLWELEATSNPPVDPANPPPLIAPETQPAAPLLVPA